MQTTQLIADEGNTSRQRHEQEQSIISCPLLMSRVNVRFYSNEGKDDPAINLVNVAGIKYWLFEETW